MHVKIKSSSLEISPLEKVNAHVDSTSHQISFDKMSIVSHEHDAASSNTTEWTYPHNPRPMHVNNTCNSISNLHFKEKRTRSKLLKSEDWNAWEASEHKQLDQGLHQQIFGQPCVPPSNCNLLPLIWIYVIKPDSAKKEHCG